MKKNLFWSMLAMSGMLFATSCSQDELVNESTGDFVSATFNIGTADGIGSRAIGEGLAIDKVACAVYDANGKEMEALYDIKDVNGGRATYSVRLAKGQNYRIAFFAYNEAAAAYDVSDLTNIKVLPGQSSNIEKRDAFTAYYDVKTGETMNSINEDVELYRPFAQLNLGVDNVEYLDAKKAGVVIEKSYIKVSNVHNAFSAYHNAVVAGNPAQSMEFALNGIPSEKLLVDTDSDGNDEEYHYLALNYLLVGDKDTEKELTDVEFAWETIDGKKNNPTTKFYNIPVQRNYRTNIIGKLLTSPADFNIIIKPAFDGDKNHDITDNVTDQVTTVSVTGIESLQDAINNATGNTTIFFDNDIDGTTSRATAASITITQKPGVNITIDGCDYKFDGTFYLSGGGGDASNTETLVFKNINFVHTDGKLDFINADNAAVGIRYAHNVTVDNCTFTGYPVAEDAEEGVMGLRYRQTYNMVVKNSTFTNMYGAMWATGANGITIDNVTVTNSKNGISLGTSDNVVINNANIDANVYGIRANGEGAYKLTVKNTAIDADQPIIVRKTTGAYSVALEGTNTLTTSKEYHVIFTNDDDEKDYVSPTGVYTITGAENFNVYPSEGTAQPAIATSAAQFKNFLANTSISEILLGEGAVIEGTFEVKRAVTIKSVNEENKGTIIGRVNVVSANPTFENIIFDRNDIDSNAAWNTANGSSNCLQYKAIVMIYGDQTNTITFEKCDFNNNMGTHKSGITNTACELIVNNCYFGGKSNAIYSQTNLSITNCYFDFEVSQNVVASLNGCGNNGGKFIFTGNKAINGDIFAVSQFLSTTGFGNGSYYFDVQNNSGFDNYYLNGYRVTDKTFAEGSETF